MDRKGSDGIIDPEFVEQDDATDDQDAGNRTDDQGSKLVDSITVRRDSNQASEPPR